VAPASVVASGWRPAERVTARTRGRSFVLISGWHPKFQTAWSRIHQKFFSDSVKGGELDEIARLFPGEMRALCATEADALTEATLEAFAPGISTAPGQFAGGFSFVPRYR
jgi:hypothetical protein